METTSNYLLQSGLCMLLLYFFYLLVLRNFPRLGYNRAFLLLAPMAALFIPVLDVRLSFLKEYTFMEALPTFELAGVTVNAGLTTTESYLRPEFILATLYTLVAFVLLAKLGVQLVRLRKLILSASHTDHTSGTIIIHTSSNYPVFAFLKYVFVCPQPHLTEQEQKQVLAHELAHVRLCHTYDVLYYEILTAILWFNPLVWLLKTELRDVHEYQADAVVVNVYHPESYTSLLAKQALYRTGIPVGSYFYKPQVFKRLHMLQQRNRKTDMLRPLLVLPLLLLLLFLFSAEGVTADKVAASITNASTKTTSDSAPATSIKIGIPEAATTAKEPTETAELPEAKASEFTQTETKAPRQNLPSAPESIPEAQEIQQKEKPYTYVEQMPLFEGSDAALQQFVAQNIRYPQEAVDQKAEGLVVVSFVVEKNGFLTEVQLVKGLTKETDAEALRVINLTSGKWQPGKQDGKTVAVRYTYPFRFQMK